MGLLVDQQRVTNRFLLDLLQEARIPDFQKERRYYIETGLKHYHNGLFEDALQNLLKAKEREPSDYEVLYRIAQIYLNVPEVRNLKQAYEHFMAAFKYSNAEGNKDFASRCLLYAGHTAYSANMNGNNYLKLAEQAIQLNPEFGETYYQTAVLLLKNGSTSKGFERLEKAILINKIYAIRAYNESEISLIRAIKLEELMQRLFLEAEQRVSSNATQLSRLKSFMSRYLDLVKSIEFNNRYEPTFRFSKHPDGKFIFTPSLKVLMDLKDQLREVVILLSIFNGRNYFDYLEFEENYKLKYPVFLRAIREVEKLLRETTKTLDKISSEIKSELEEVEKKWKELKRRQKSSNIFLVIWYGIAFLLVVIPILLKWHFMYILTIFFALVIPLIVVPFQDLIPDTSKEKEEEEQEEQKLLKLKKQLAKITFDLNNLAENHPNKLLEEFPDIKHLL